MACKSWKEIRCTAVAGKARFVGATLLSILQGSPWMGSAGMRNFAKNCTTVASTRPAWCARQFWPVRSLPVRRYWSVASGIDYYGFAQTGLFDEDEIDESGTGGESYLAALCWDWEEETKLCSEAGIRVACMRTGLVLGEDGGALPKLLKIFRSRFGGRLGSGMQWMSWVHVDDVVGAYLHAVTSELHGPINLVAPANCRNREFTDALARVVRKPAFLPVPGPILKAALGEFAEYVLKGRRAVPKALLDAGYTFSYPTIEEALHELVRV